MPQQQQARSLNRTGSRTSIWLAFAAALVLHVVFLLLPIAMQVPETDSLPAQIELQLSTYSPPAAEPEKPAPQPEPETKPPEPIDDADEIVAKTEPEIPEPVLAPTPIVKQAESTVMSEPDRRQLTRSVLSAQFITQASEADKIFGKPLELPDATRQGDFRYPIQKDMMSMLDRPIPDLPFAYTPGLVRFAYDPGVKGDLQRFWDVITPEFGWKTDNGTEIRCIWVLVVMGCGWK